MDFPNEQTGAFDKTMIPLRMYSLQAEGEQKKRTTRQVRAMANPRILHRIYPADGWPIVSEEWAERQVLPHLIGDD
jgi:hypothetical protein